jgi:hypothetical protein
MRKMLVFLLSFLWLQGFSQNRKTENLLIVTMDGMRWQEVFKGLDTVLANDTLFSRDPKGLKEKFGSDNEEERRKKLFPFFWNVIAKEGQLYGNRKYGNQMDNANRYWFSYPGYNEIFTGYPDTAVNSNDKVMNKNENVLEFINKQKAYHDKVAAFTTWDAFPYILNKPRSGVYVNADLDTLNFHSSNLQLINDIQFLTTRPLGVRPDVLTYIAAREYLKEYKPKVLYIAFDETDDFAHEGLYDQYIGSAHAEDAMIADLWKTVQSMPEYAGHTTLLITCDHGRGDKIKSNWQHHGTKTEDSHEIWMAVMGPDTKATGEMKNAGQLYQEQIAETLAQFLGFTFKANHPVAEPVQSAFSK